MFVQFFHSTNCINDANTILYVAFEQTVCTSQPLYNTFVKVQANFHISYPNCATCISRAKCIVIYYDHLGAQH